MIIRTAVQSDARELAALSGELGYPVPAEAVRQRLARIEYRADHLVMVAVLDGVLVGWLQAHAVDTLESGLRVEVVGLIISRQTRRQGIGRMMVECAEQWARQCGTDTIIVRTNVKRVESHAFYSAIGFKPSKIQTVFRKRLLRDGG